MNVYTCPFCSSSSVRLRAMRGMHRVFCDGCLAGGPWVRSESLAVSMWNGQGPRTVAHAIAAVEVGCEYQHDGMTLRVVAVDGDNATLLFPSGKQLTLCVDTVRGFYARSARSEAHAFSQTEQP